MRDRRFGLAAAAIVLACTALVVGCGAHDEAPGQPAPDAPSAAASHESGNAGTTERRSPAPAAGSADCSSAQHRATRSISLGQAVREVTSARTGFSVTARDTVAKHTAKVGARLLEKCGGHAPRAFERFSADLRPVLARDRFGDSELDQVLAAWLRWGSAVEAPEAPRLEMQILEFCRREFFPRFDASYRIWWKWTRTGKAWWVDITFDNRTGQVLDGDMGGTAKVTKLLEDPFGWEQGPKLGPGKDATLSWGGSSAEVLELQPGVTKVTAAPDIDQDVHTTVDGTFRATEMTVGLVPRGGRYGCSPPVLPTP